MWGAGMRARQGQVGKVGRNDGAASRSSEIERCSPCARHTLRAASEMAGALGYSFLAARLTTTADWRCDAMRTLAMDVECVRRCADAVGDARSCMCLGRRVRRASRWRRLGSRCCILSVYYLCFAPAVRL